MDKKYTEQEFREELLEELIMQGATEEQLKVPEETIWNAMRKHRSPADVAWALLQ